ncbi:unnamed protein product [Clonostachys rhizophaga]|uniref:Uncharacterized protein n=1 Tax=Clonostachys rhizophaga TaxID=160324 RepID=A0A9N9VUP4_9HYPO|nr:unnamed protein product [Clonostachys rhizophaga]
MDPINPSVDWELDRSWLWPAWKFGLAYEDIFHTLHNQHNTVEIPLQDFRAFYYDVRELAAKASTRDELDRLLCERKQSRSTELLKAFDDAALQLAGDPSSLPGGMWVPSVELFRTRSLASLVMFFAGFLPDDTLKRVLERRKEGVKEKPANIVSASVNPGSANDRNDNLRNPDRSPQEAPGLPSQPPLNPAKHPNGQRSSESTKPASKQRGGTRLSKRQQTETVARNKATEQRRPRKQQTTQSSKRQRTETAAVKETAERNRPNKRRRTTDEIPAPSRYHMRKRCVS